MPLSRNSEKNKDSRADMPLMQHRHFAAIARTISDLDLPWQSPDLFTIGRESIAKHFADTLAKSNPRFDRERFIRACF